MSVNKKIDLYQDLYKQKTDYLRNLYPMYRLINSCINFKLESFLDYGCGKSNLAEIFENNQKIKIYKYDPAIEQYSYLKKNLKVDLIANCDVMEHIPEDEIDALFTQMSNISQNIFFNIYLKEAETILPNGENAHCTVKSISWWKSKILCHFKYANIVFNSYRNSVCIITWKVNYLVKFKNFIAYCKNNFDHLLYKLINFKLWK